MIVSGKYMPFCNLRPAVEVQPEPRATIVLSARHLEPIFSARSQVQTASGMGAPRQQISRNYGALTPNSVSPVPMFLP